MNISEINNKISKINYPHIFLFLLLIYKSHIDDFNFSLILKLYLKNHMDVALNIDLLKLFKENIPDYKISLNILKNFYKLIKKKYLLILLIKKWYNIYNNDIFWQLDINEQIDYILNLKLQFLAIFDCSKGGALYHLKLYNQLKLNNVHNNEIIENMIDRLILLLKLFDYKIFESLQIPLIKTSDFYNLDHKYYIKYFALIFQKINNLLADTLLLFESYNLICNKLNNLLNPNIIIIIDIYNIDNDIIC